MTDRNELKIHYDAGGAYRKIYVNPATGEVLESNTVLADSIKHLSEENNRLRGALAKGKGDCVYCQLPATDIAKCHYGFPGCGRMDDLINAVNTESESRMEGRIVELLVETGNLKARMEEIKAERDHLGRP